MLSDEEKKALERIDYIQDFIIENGQYNADVNDMEYFSKILNLIEKQSKEIEELKENNKKLTDEYLVQRDLINPDFLKDYISKDKIKAKIEELNNKLKNADEIEAVFIIKQQQVLQSLLEKE